jgi:exonuclease III
MSENLKLLSWNIMHSRRTDEIVSVVNTLAPDICVFTEYRPTGTSSSLDNLLKDWNVEVPTTFGDKKNGVLIASRRELKPGEILGPSWAPASFLHVNLPDYGLDVIGYRTIVGNASVRSLQGCQDEERASNGDRRVQLKWLTTHASGGLKARNSLITGDFNVDFNYKSKSLDARYGADLLRGMLRDGGWTSAFPPELELYSFYSGKKRCRLDHTLLSPRNDWRVTKAEYVTAVDGRVIASGLPPRISDHAAMWVELFRKPSVR